MSTTSSEPQAATSNQSRTSSETGNDSTKPKPPKKRLYLKPAPWFGSYQLPKAVQSSPYEPQKLEVTNGTGPYQFAVVTDFELAKLFDRTHRLPPGLELSPDGTISGTPRQGGTYNFKVEASDAEGLKGTCHYTIAVELDLNHFSAYFDEMPGGAVASSGKPDISRFDAEFVDADDKPKYPLSLCEFLSYKAGQAYLNEDPKNPENCLKELLKRSHPDVEIDKHFRFFDSTTPLKVYSAAELEQLDSIPADKAPDHWSGFDAKQVKKLNKRRKRLDTQAYGFVFEGRAFIICRGTSSLEDARVDIDNGLTTDDPEKRSTLQSIKYSIGLRSKKVIMTEEERILVGGPDPETYLKPARAVGFAAAWAAIRDQVENWIQTLPEANKKEFVFSGHSLGGALAFVGAQEFAEKRQRRIHAVVTFGAPCVGMSKETAGGRPEPYFVESYHQLQNGELKNRTIRLESSNDAVPKLMRVKNFDHVGRQWEIEFKPLPGSFTLFRRKYLTGPLLYLGRAMLSGGSDSFSWSAVPKKGLGYAILYGLPLFNRVLAAHSADSRYALFLSTIAYRKIRSSHIGDLMRLDPKNDKTLVEKYATANSTFKEHLGLMLGKALQGVKTPRIIDCPKTELSYGRKYYGRARTEYLF